MMVIIRRAVYEDLNFLVETDLLGDGYTINPNDPPMSLDDLESHRNKILSFVLSLHDCGWIAEDEEKGEKVGMVLARYRDIYNEPDSEANQFLFRYIDKTMIPDDGRFCEMFQLWVAPALRRQGIATRLKLQVEQEARQRGIHMIYTHTETRNQHVIDMNLKLGYQIIRCGPMWDDISRTSLVKYI